VQICLVYDVFCTDFEHYMCAKFHFVDLAGSERANRTGNVGERFKGDTYSDYVSLLVVFAVNHFVHLLCFSFC